MIILFQLSGLSDSSKRTDNLLNELDLSDVKTCYARHCPNAFGITLTDKNGLKLTYSGDTMPTENLIKIGNWEYSS